MPLTENLFLWVSGVALAVGLALLIPLLISVIGIRGDLKPIASLDQWLRHRGLDATLLGKIAGADMTAQSLSPEKVVERDQLVALARTGSLNEQDATRLRELLREDALNDLAKGAIGVLAFIGILAVLNALSKN